MHDNRSTDSLNEEPSAADLAAIEAEWPLIEADLEALDQEIRALGVTSTLQEVDVRRARRLGRASLRAVPSAHVPGVRVLDSSWSRGEAA